MPQPTLRRTDEATAMKFSHFFIRRPIFATVLSLITMLLGGLSFFNLPVSQFPEVVPPTVIVRATYPGADAKTVADTVAAPLEQEINGVDNMIYMNSVSTADGALTLTVTFRPGINLDDALVQVQNRVAVALPRLPETVRQLGVVAQKRVTDQLLLIHLYSPNESRDQSYIANYALTQIRDPLMRVPGVGEVLISGAGEYAMRIWLDPDRMAALDLTAEEVMAALRAYNVQVAAGNLNLAPTRDPGAFQVNVRTQGRLTDPAQFGDIIVKRSQGRVARLRDVARVELGQYQYTTNAYLDGKAAAALIVFQKPDANALDTARELQQRIRELSAGFPPDMAYDIIVNPTEFVEQSLDEVYYTLFEAVVYVILVVMLFLGNWRAAIIPIAAIPVSLIGTFAVMDLFGFSLNMLSLFGLVLAIGIVVDDAIVVVESIERHMEEGLSSREAAHKTMDEVGSALVSIALVLSAVFIPTVFIPGLVGTFFKQFALTIAVSTLLSAAVSLTLSPALGALFLKRPDHSPVRNVWRHPFQALTRGFNRGFDRLAEHYGIRMAKLVRRSTRVGLIYLVLIGITLFTFARLPTALVPSMDRGFLMTIIQLPPGAQLERTDAVVRKAIALLHELPGVAHTGAYSGRSVIDNGTDSNAGTIFVVLDDFGERASASALAPLLQRKLSEALPEAAVIVTLPPPIIGLGSTGFRLMVQDRGGLGLDTLQQAVQTLAAEANKDPHLARVFSTFNVNNPTLFVEVDRIRAEMLDVPLERVHNALQTYFGMAIANDFNMLGRTFRVAVQAEPESRRQRDDIARVRVRANSGALVPLGSLVTFEETASPFRLPRYNLFPAAALDGTYPPHVSSSIGIAAMEEIAARVLPSGIGYEWTDIAWQEKQLGNTAIIVFGLAVLFVFLVLAAQYESWLLPLSVILIVPMCLLCAAIGLLLRGIDANLLAQIGFVVLIGLASKNAVLIVQFASALEREGMPRLQAVQRAANLRLRPIIMTSLAFSFGVLPLVLASGAGAELRTALGTSVFFGMIGVTLFGLLFTPVFYVLCRRLGDWLERRKSGAADPAAVE
jgi:HAE1 family hydrophobic/amphiphilic exporter-1